MIPLRIDRVTQQFGGLVALDDVSAEIGDAPVTAIIGPNGAGKTTLFNIVSGFQTPSAGRVRFNDEDITGVPPEQVAARGIIRTFQLVQLFQELTVLENVMIGRHLKTGGGIVSALLRTASARREESAVEERASALLARVGLAPLSHVLAGTLPYGQQRLLEIARALAAEPRLLLLDEPAAGLNRDETSRLSALIRSVADEGLVVLLIEHDMHLVMNTADKVIVLDFGRKIAEGAPSAVQNSPAVIAAYLGDTGDADA